MGDNWSWNALAIIRSECSSVHLTARQKASWRLSKYTPRSSNRNSVLIVNQSDPCLNRGSDTKLELEDGWWWRRGVHTTMASTPVYADRGAMTGQSWMSQSAAERGESWLEQLAQ